jgi:Flp pilus assembly protein TadG
MMRPSIRSGRTPRRGVAVVEFAAVVPLLLLLLLGLWEVGRLLQAKQILANAAREGGRQAATGLKSTAEVQQYVRNSIQRAGLNITGMPDPVITNLTSSARNDPRDANQLDRYSIHVSLPTANFRWVLFQFTTPTLDADAVWVSLADIPLGDASEVIPD